MHYIKTTGNYLHELRNMVAQYGDWFTEGDVKEVADLKLGQGGIILSGLKKQPYFVTNRIIFLSAQQFVLT